MPIYEYRCQSCRRSFERTQRFSDDPLTTCPACGGPVRRVLHPVGIIFKGSGWYSTDSRKGGNGVTSSSADDWRAKDKDSKTETSSSTAAKSSSS